MNFGDPSGRYEVYLGSEPCIVGAGEYAETTGCDYYSEFTFTSEGPYQDLGGGGAMIMPHSQIGGFSLAMDALDNPQCAGAVQPNGTPQSAQSGLNNEKYIAWYPGIPSSTGFSSVAETSGNTVKLNTAIFTDPENVTTASVTAAGPVYSTQNWVSGLVQAMQEMFGLALSNVTTTDFQAIYLLHELGHSLGGLAGDSTSNNQSMVNTMTIIENCFPSLIQQ